ncbi:Clp protease N-terminal domain-containing protein [Nocardioides iriomotensis]|uniref:ATP-dependent Clp protease ATP-binding subunit n=1 Tax=Nocardioides iriomotensis TaxID=715784 RepID=A0A4Q5J2B4_9ACTN|nr:Clp protease N-terminal domain-containing protein [Nocardioides iriomotensis]RYU11591.1 ATP-dependent Clp protease ATP-binding subunit [Nocardioides iriomotensis]
MVNVSLEELVAQVETSAPQGSALRLLSLAVLGSRELTEAADDLVGHFVERARAEGASWSEIGAAMGVSKQAAQQRAQSRADEPDQGDLEGYDADVRTAVRIAQERARAHRHHYVGTEHLLVGVLALPPGRVAAAVGLTADAAMDAALEIVGEGALDVTRTPGLTARALKVMQIAVREARHLGSDEVAPAHVLLALVREGRGVAAQVLDEQLGSLDRVREAAADLLNG